MTVGCRGQHPHSPHSFSVYLHCEGERTDKLPFKLNFRRCGRLLWPLWFSCHQLHEHSPPVSLMPWSEILVYSDPGTHWEQGWDHCRPWLSPGYLLLSEPTETDINHYLYSPQWMVYPIFNFVNERFHNFTRSSPLGVDINNYKT